MAAIDTVPVGLIWAEATDPDGRRVIGADGGLPWHVPEDLAHFKRTTSGHPVLMGRRTWDSLPLRFRPLAGRTSFVVTRDPDFEAIGEGSGEVHVSHSVDAALDEARARALADTGSGADVDEPVVWVAGGGQLYTATLGVATVASVTELALGVAGDTAAPVLGDDWRELSLTPWRESSAGIHFRIRELRRDLPG